MTIHAASKGKNNRRLYYLALALLAVLRFLCSYGMLVWFIPGTQYDDVMQTTKVANLLAGNWLGEYGSMTLVKGAGYPLLTALFSAVGIPYIQAYHLLYVGACALFLWAASPMVRSRVLRVVIWGFLLFNPIAFSASLTRLYRDIGYYSVAFLCVSATLGMLLRYDRKRAPFGFALATGLTLGFAAIYREDSHWLYIYIAVCLAVFLWFRARALRPGWRLAPVPALVAAGWACVILPVCMANWLAYGTFVTDEYNSGPYAGAYGALSRLDGGSEDPHITIPTEQRMLLYEHSPAFARLYESLDGPNAPYAVWKQEQGEYRTGYFSFILRDAAAGIGVYENAQTANAYFTLLAREANALADSGLVQAGPKRSGITARFYPWMTGPVLRATGEGMLAALRCVDIDPLPIPTAQDDAYLAYYENLVHTGIAADRYMPDGTIVPNYHFSGFRLWMQRLARLIVLAYRYTLLPLFLLALLAYGFVLARHIKRRTRAPGLWLHALAVASLLCLFALRAVMLGFVHISSFAVLYTASYQAACYPVILAFIGLAFAFAVKHWPGKLFVQKM